MEIEETVRPLLNKRPSLNQPPKWEVLTRESIHEKVLALPAGTMSSKFKLHKSVILQKKLTQCPRKVLLKIDQGTLSSPRPWAQTPLLPNLYQ